MISGPSCGHRSEGGEWCELEAHHVGALHGKKIQVGDRLVEIWSWGDDGVVTRSYIDGVLEDTEGRIY